MDILKSIKETAEKTEKMETLTADLADNYTQEATIIRTMSNIINGEWQYSFFTAIDRKKLYNEEIERLKLVLSERHTILENIQLEASKQLYSISQNQRKLTKFKIN